MSRYLCAGVISVVSHNGRKQNCASLAVRHIVVCGKGVSHRVVNAESDIREAHACYVLTESHALSSLGRVLNSAAKRKRER